MQQYRGDILIRDLRKKKGLTQKVLCEGICSRDELSRIERGERRPRWYVFQRLMQRLGENPDRYYVDYVTVENKRISDAKEKVKQLLRERTEENDREAETLISELEQDETFMIEDNTQFLLECKASLAFHRQDYQATYEHATTAIKVSKPDFDEDKIDMYILTYDEIQLINQIASAHAHISSLEKSAEIFIKLKVVLDKHYLDDSKFPRIYMTLLANISKALGLLARYEECMEICDVGISFCKVHGDASFYPDFLLNKACCLLSLGNRQQDALRLLEKFYALLDAYDFTAEIQATKAYLKETYSIC